MFSNVRMHRLIGFSSDLLRRIDDRGWGRVAAPDDFFYRGWCESTRDIPVGQFQTFGALSKKCLRGFCESLGFKWNFKASSRQRILTARIAFAEHAFQNLICSPARFPQGGHRKCRKSFASS